VTVPREVLMHQVQTNIGKNIMLDQWCLIPVVELVVTRQGICDLVQVALDIIYVKVEMQQIFHPSHLPGRQATLHMEELQCLMVHDNMEMPSYQLILPLK
jgi:hypothetical protein